MREGWEAKKLGEVIEKSGTIDPRKNSAAQFQYVDVSSVSRKSNQIEEVATLYGADAPSRARRLIKSGDVIFATIRPTLQRIAQVPEELDGQVCSTGYFVFRTKPEVDSRYLYYYLFSAEFMEAMEMLQSGASYPAVNDSQVKSQTIPLPPLAEQRRIVAMLDEAFEGIAVALAAATKNLANARELFETTLNVTFTQKGEGWDVRKLGDADLLQIIDGDRGTNYPKKSDFSDEGNCLFLNTKNVRPDGFNFDVTMFISKEKDQVLRKGKLERRDVLLTTRGTIGNIALYDSSVPFDNIRINSGMLIFRPNEKEILADYLFELFRSSFFKSQVSTFVSGAAQPQLPIKTLVNFDLPVPTSLGVQKEIVEMLRAIWKQTQRLEALYQQKIDALTELKQSLLQKAFVGELTAADAVQAVVVANTQSPEFAANIIAFNFRQHEKAQQGKTYGRVKAQKGLHLVEAIGGVDLGRVPVKDAAGPNDSDHARSAENWAKDNQFFEFVLRPNGKGYDFVKLPKYNKLLAQAETSLAACSDDIRKAIAPLVHMRTEAAEVFTTVHAAWNNLLIEGDEITDEAIVTEAREDWHPDKLKIIRNKFFEAIKDIRQRGLEPKGKGWRVDGQERLL